MKNWKNTKKHKTDSRGMTLLELVIAVSIFSIAALVLFQGFVTSGRINRKSNLYLEATTTAQNVMEEVKSMNFADVSAAFNYPIDRTTGSCRFSFLAPQQDKINSGGEDGLLLREMVKTKDGFGDVRQYRDSDGEDLSQVTASVVSKDGGATYEFHPRKKGEQASRYYFEMRNVKNHHEKFDVLAEFDGSQSSGYKKASYGDINKKNDFEMPNIARLDTKNNAFLIMGKKWDDAALKNMVSGQLIQAKEEWSENSDKYTEMGIQMPGEEPLLDQEDVYERIKRTLHIKLEQTGGVVTAKARYTLDANRYAKAGGNPLETMGLCPGSKSTGAHDGTGGCFCTYSSAYTSFYSSEADADLKGIYVFYYPNYNSTDMLEPLDYIEFDNEINYPVNLYVIKQRDDSAGLPTAQQEIRYRMKLEVSEIPEIKTWNTSPGIYKAKTILRTNLDSDVSNLTEPDKRAKVKQMKLTYRGRIDKDSPNYKSVSDSAAKSILDMNGLDDKEARDRIYAAKISVYKAGAAEENYPKDKLVAALDGAKEN